MVRVRLVRSRVRIYVCEGTHKDRNTSMSLFAGYVSCVVSQPSPVKLGTRRWHPCTGPLAVILGGRLSLSFMRGLREQGNDGRIEGNGEENKEGYPFGMEAL